MNRNGDRISAMERGELITELSQQESNQTQFEEAIKHKNSTNLRKLLQPSGIRKALDLFGFNKVLNWVGENPEESININTPFSHKIKSDNLNHFIEGTYHPLVWAILGGDLEIISALLNQKDLAVSSHDIHYIWHQIFIEKHFSIVQKIALLKLLFNEDNTFKKLLPMQLVFKFNSKKYPIPHLLLDAAYEAQYQNPDNNNEKNYLELLDNLIRLISKNKSEEDLNDLNAMMPEGETILLALINKLTKLPSTNKNYNRYYELLALLSSSPGIILSNIKNKEKTPLEMFLEMDPLPALASSKTFIVNSLKFDPKKAVPIFKKMLKRNLEYAGYIYDISLPISVTPLLSRELSNTIDDYNFDAEKINQLAAHFSGLALNYIEINGKNLPEHFVEADKPELLQIVIDKVTLFKRAFDIALLSNKKQFDTILLLIDKEEARISPETDTNLQQIKKEKLLMVLQYALDKKLDTSKIGKILERILLLEQDTLPGQGLLQNCIDLLVIHNKIELLEKVLNHRDNTILTPALNSALLQEQPNFKMVAFLLTRNARIQDEKDAKLITKMLEGLSGYLKWAFTAQHTFQQMKNIINQMVNLASEENRKAVLLQIVDLVIMNNNLELLEVLVSYDKNILVPDSDKNPLVNALLSPAVTSSTIVRLLKLGATLRDSDFSEVLMVKLAETVIAAAKDDSPEGIELLNPYIPSLLGCEKSRALLTKAVLTESKAGMQLNLELNPNQKYLEPPAAVSETIAERTIDLAGVEEVPYKATEAEFGCGEVDLADLVQEVPFEQKPEDHEIINSHQEHDGFDLLSAEIKELQELQENDGFQQLSPEDLDELEIDAFQMLVEDRLEKVVVPPESPSVSVTKPSVLSWNDIKKRSRPPVGKESALQAANTIQQFEEKSPRAEGKRRGI